MLLDDVSRELDGETARARGTHGGVARALVIEKDLERPAGYGRRVLGSTRAGLFEGLKDRGGEFQGQSVTRDNLIDVDGVGRGFEGRA